MYAGVFEFSRDLAKCMPWNGPRGSDLRRWAARSELMPTPPDRCRQVVSLAKGFRGMDTIVSKANDVFESVRICAVTSANATR